MEPSINKQKTQAMKSYKRAKLLDNLVLYCLTSLLTCFFFSYPFWFPSIANHFLSLLPSMVITYCFNAKCFFLVGNLIVLVLVGETKLKQSSSTPDMYDEYIARSRSSHHKEMINGTVKTLIVEEKIHHQEGEEEVKNSIPHGGEKKRGMRSCKSEVWDEGGMMMKMEKSKSKKEEQVFNGEKVKMGMRSSKSAVWSENERVKMEKDKGKREGQSNKASMKDEDKKMGMKSSKSAVSSESEKAKIQKANHKEEEQSNMKKMGMRNSKSAVWGEREIDEGKGEEEMKNNIEKKMGMRSCRSEIWSENEIVRLGKTMAKEEDEQQLNVLNKRVEDFIARVNKQRLLEA